MEGAGPASHRAHDGEMQDVSVSIQGSQYQAVARPLGLGPTSSRRPLDSGPSIPRRPNSEDVSLGGGPSPTNQKKPKGQTKSKSKDAQKKKRKGPSEHLKLEVSFGVRAFALMQVDESGFSLALWCVRRLPSVHCDLLGILVVLLSIALAVGVLVLGVCLISAGVAHVVRVRDSGVFVVVLPLVYRCVSLLPSFR
ncbi:hypothetical protein Ancab_014018 [Ancistrocladus abbreviatus]